jgi:succinoglycan biosynthesis transport protein ExoP
MLTSEVGLVKEAAESSEASTRPSANEAQPLHRSHSIGLAEIMNALARRKGLISACILTITTIVGIYIWTLPREYDAQTLVSIEGRKTKITDLQAIVSGVQPGKEQIRTEAEILESPTLAAQVVNQLDLTRSPEFSKSFSLSHYAINAVPAGLLEIFGLDREELLALNQPGDSVKRATDSLMKRLTIDNDGRSYVFKIRVRSRSPELAAKLANTYAEIYLADQTTAKQQVSRRANGWLKDRLNELHQKAVASENAVAEFREKHQLVGARGLTLNSQQLSDLNGQLTVATTERVQKEAQLAQIKSALASPSGVAATSEVLASPLIQKLRMEEAGLLREKAALASKFMPEHPKMKDLQSQIDSMEDSLKREMNKVAVSLTADLSTSRAHEALLRSKLAQLAESANRENAADVQLADLEREKNANKALYEDFLTRFKEVAAQDGGETPDARVVSAASIPDQPAFPRRGLSLAIAALASCIVGASLALLLEHLDRRVRSESQAEAITGVPAMGYVPALRRANPIEVIVREPNSTYSEAIRNVGTALQLRPSQVLVVTSSVPQEGKSVFACSLARSVAESGGRVLLIDCDLRRPMVGRLLRGKATAGLREIIQERQRLDEAVLTDSETGLNYIVASGSEDASLNPQQLLSSRAFVSLLNYARREFDLVILDAPPILAVLDALILGRLADLTVFAVQWGATPQPVIEAAARKLRMNVHGDVCLVLSRVDLRQHARYRFGDFGYYHQHFEKYYRRRAKETVRA